MSTPKSTQASPRPWSWSRFGRYLVILDAEGIGVVELKASEPDAEDRANTIVRAVNAHDDAVALARMVIDNEGTWEGALSPLAQAARAYLAKVGA